MIEQIYFHETDNTIPYNNIALEEYLMTNVKPKECILYLWQNRATVVIGRNQNPWKEADTAQLEADGGFLARRLSGGGAVFHDMGNLNFTFLVKEEDYDVEKQLKVILEAVKKLGIKAEKSGRNDITIDGYKFSGNAFYTSKGNSYHHGTIMFKVNKEDVAKYLNVSRKKLQAKGIDSVRSRVANLTDFNPEITLEQLSNALIESFGEVYNLQPEQLPDNRIDNQAVAKAAEGFASYEWKYGKSINFTYQIEERFNWGEIEINLKVEQGKIEECLIYSDSLNPHYIDALTKALVNAQFNTTAMITAINEIPFSETTKEMQESIIQLIEAENL